MAKADKARARFGSVRALPSGRHQARYVGPDMQRYTAPRTFETQGDAQGWLREEENLILLDVWTAPAERARAKEAEERALTVDAYGQSWLTERDVRPKTLSEYRRFWASRVEPYLGDEPLASLDTVRVRKWWADIRAKHDTPTANARAYSLLKTVLGDAVRDKHLDTNPCQIRGAGTAPKNNELTLITKDQLNAIAAGMPDRYRAAVYVAAWGGLRFGELTELRRKDIVDEGSMIRVRRAVVRVDGKELIGTPKSDDGVRDIHLPNSAALALRHHMAAFTDSGREALVFTTRSGGRVTPTRLRTPFQKAVQLAGIDERVRLHDLRHFGATMAARAGATTKELMSRLGHSTPTMSMRYQHAVTERDAALAARMDDMAG